ncbi:MAG: folate-binding protein [Promicromonosporaceae bacterium]|nr:folate-binding protein [Promicromonosporaceae bacterium]
MTAHFGDPLGEQRALTSGEAVVDCSDLSILHITGVDRLRWLHDLTTQQLIDLEPGRSVEALILSPTGRIEHAFGAVDDGETTWLLTEGSAGAQLVTWLDSMRFTRRVEVTDVSADWAAIGDFDQAQPKDSTSIIWLDPWPGITPGGTRYGPPTVEHPGADWRWCLTLVPRANLTAEIATRQEAGLRLAGSWAQEALRIAAWRPRLGSEVDNRSLPHELDWLRTAVHLRKGCYRGQETVAHVHNLGHPPRRLVFLHLDGSDHLLPEAGASVTLADGSPVGTLTSVARHYELGPIGLAVIKRTASAAAPLLADGIAAAQEEIVPVAGVSIDRPPPRGPLTRGLLAPSRAIPGAAPGLRTAPSTRHP